MKLPSRSEIGSTRRAGGKLKHFHSIWPVD
jgi:hypothetical protein